MQPSGANGMLMVPPGVKPDPFFWNAANAPLLSSGTAFIQVCIFDSTNQGDTDPNGFVFDYSMKKVVIG
jgi:hypothetical protein